MEGTTLLEKSCTGSNWPTTCALLCATAAAAHRTDRMAIVNGSQSCFHEDQLEYVGMDILRLLRKKEAGNQSVVVMTDRSVKLTKAIPTIKTHTSIVACILLEHWVTNYDTPSKLLTNSGPELVTKFFTEVCSTLGMKIITTTEDLC